MFLGRILLATFPLAYALAPNIFVIYAVEPVAGLTSLLGSTAYVSYLYDSSTKEDVKMSLGVYSLVQGLGAVVGSLISSAIFMGGRTHTGTGEGSGVPPLDLGRAEDHDLFRLPETQGVNFSARFNLLSPASRCGVHG